MLRKTLFYVLGGGRAAIALSAWLVPDFTLNFCGFDEITPARSAHMVCRLFGIRDVLLGSALVYHAHQDDYEENSQTTDTLLKVCAGTDAVDAVATLIAVQQGLNNPSFLTLATAGASWFALIGLYLLKSSPKKKSK